MSPKRPMSLIRVYLFVKTVVFKKEHIQLVFKLKTTCIKITIPPFVGKQIIKCTEQGRVTNPKQKENETHNLQEITTTFNYRIGLPLWPRRYIQYCIQLKLKFLMGVHGSEQKGNFIMPLWQLKIHGLHCGCFQTADITS